MLEGCTGVVYKESPEAEAFNRWQEGRFRDVERDHAKRWRQELEYVDLKANARVEQYKIRRDESRQVLVFMFETTYILNGTAETPEAMIVRPFFVRQDRCESSLA